MIANIRQTNRPPVNNNPPLFTLEGGEFALVRPEFGAGSGALQLSLKPPNPSQPNATFGGSTTLSADGPAPGYGSQVLGADVATIFQDQFSDNGGVPVLAPTWPATARAFGASG